MGKQLRYPISTFIASVMLLRSYLFLRLFTIFTDFRTELSDKICAKVGIEADVIFALKASFKQHTFAFVGVCFAITTVMFGLSVQLFERPYYDDTDLQPIDELNPNY